MKCAFKYFGDPDTTETQRFVSYFDTFFDCLNVRSWQEWVKKRKPNLKPYQSPGDERLVVSTIDCVVMMKKKFGIVFSCSG